MRVARQEQACAPHSGSRTVEQVLASVPCMNFKSCITRSDARLFGAARPLMQRNAATGGGQRDDSMEIEGEATFAHRPADRRMSRGVRVQAAARTRAPAGGAAGADPLRECLCVFVSDVHPARMLNAQEAVRDELNAKLMRCVAARRARAVYAAELAAQWQP